MPINFSTCCRISHSGFGEGKPASSCSSSSTEPTVGPLSINATALNAFDIQVSWDPVQQLSTNGLLRGYEVGLTWCLGSGSAKFSLVVFQIL